VSADTYILVVDDEPNIRQLIALVLAREGYRVETAASGHECLERVHRQSPALILLDLQMPGLTGVEVIERLRAEATTREIPIVLISGSTYLTGFSRVDNVEGFIEKPFDLDDLLTTVGRFCPAIARSSVSS